MMKRLSSESLKSWRYLQFTATKCNVFTPESVNTCLGKKRAKAHPEENKWSLLASVCQYTDDDCNGLGDGSVERSAPLWWQTSVKGKAGDKCCKIRPTWCLEEEKKKSTFTWGELVSFSFRLPAGKQALNSHIVGGDGWWWWWWWWWPQAALQWGNISPIAGKRMKESQNL